jgi:hypothetical protein
VVGVKGISLTRELTGTLRAARALDTVSISIKECLIPQSTRLGLKRNKPVLHHTDLMFSRIKAAVRA